MQSKATNINDYLAELPADRKDVITALRNAIKDNLPAGFEEAMSYGMIGYVVPHSLYPAGYHCTPALPLPFLNIASQKNHIAIYHMCVYAKPELYNWFVVEYPKYTKTKLDMGKSCVRFKKAVDVPIDLFAELAKKVSVQEWIEIYENAYVKK